MAPEEDVDSDDGSLFRFGREWEWVWEWEWAPARVHVFLGRFARTRSPTEHQTAAANTCMSWALYAWTCMRQLQQ